MSQLIRKQYHARQVGHDLHIWDVHRLLRLAKPLTPVWVPLDEIAELDQNWWFADSEQLATPRAIAEHMQLVAQADLAYPILLSEDGRLVDGMHRLVKALLQQQMAILAIRLSLPEPDYINQSLADLPYPDQEV